MGEITIDGRNLKDFGINVDGGQSFDSPEWEYEKVTIPGRNGDLLLPVKRMKNVQVSYKAGITKDFARNAKAARSFLMLGGYRRIEDTYDPDTFRMGIFTGPMEFDTIFLNRAGETTLVFDCKPQRWLKSGESGVFVNSGDMITNDWHPAKPEINISGNGAATIQVGNSYIRIADIKGSITLDCDTLNAYSGSENRNHDIQVSGGWPVLEHGGTQISWAGNIRSVVMTPHWWMP